MIELHYNNSITEEKYISADGQWIMKRIPTLKWALKRNGLIIDTDAFRDDLAERNNMRLVYLEGNKK
jgi:hypothetical protein